jgi:serine O-acetyltransferase
MDRAPRCREHGHDTWRGTWRNVQGDIVRQLTMSPETAALGDGLKRRLSAFLRPEIQCLFLHRVSHYLHAKGRVRLGRIVARMNFLLHKASITPQSCIGPGCRLPHPPGMYFHGQAGAGLTLFSLAVCGTDDTCLEGSLERAPYLGDRVLLGAHAVLMGPIVVGPDTKVPYSVRLAADAPARVVVVSRNLRTTRRTAALAR